MSDYPEGCSGIDLTDAVATEAAARSWLGWFEALPDDSSRQRAAERVVAAIDRHE